jgi:hypothetical protein
MSIPENRVQIPPITAARGQFCSVPEGSDKFVVDEEISGIGGMGSDEKWGNCYTD